MSEPSKVIEVQPAIEQRIQALTEALAAALGESIEATRRTVELSVLTGGVEHARRQVEKFVGQSKRMGWPA